MRFLIKNPAPVDVEDQVYWGDTFFGNALSRCLVSAGHEVDTLFWPEWEAPASADVLVVLRGIRDQAIHEGEFGLKVLWIISHPDDISDDELNQYDLVLCGSSHHADQLRTSGYNAEVFLQCTDSSVFFLQQGAQATPKNTFVFVGNARAERLIVHDAIKARLPLRIWGRGWKRAGHQQFVVEPFIHNHLLGNLYRESICSLNDHWSDMADYQYVNNRVFDALACGLPLISDPHAGLAELGFGGIVYREPGQEIADVADDFAVNYDAVKARAIEDSKMIREKHTFAVRASRLIDLVKQNSDLT